MYKIEPTVAGPTTFQTTSAASSSATGSMMKDDIPIRTARTYNPARPSGLTAQMRAKKEIPLLGFRQQGARESGRGRA